MDWNRAKSILIAMFLIINIFLSYQLYTISRNQYKYIDHKELQSVEEYLKKKNVLVEGAIPDRVYIAPSITVQYHEFESEKMAETFFNSSSHKLEETAADYKRQNDSITIEVKNRYNFTYVNQDISIGQDEIDEDKCLNNAYSFISKLKLSSNYRYVKLKEVKNGYVRLVLGQQYNSIPVENSQIEIVATEEGVSQAKISWFDFIKPAKKYNITTPVVALLKAYESRGEEEKEETVVVRQIRQGYYFNTSIKNNQQTDVVLGGTISPMWVIQSDKNEIYINAYNENFEKVR